MKRTAVAILAAGLLLLTTTINTFAQINASVGGTVTDASGALIPGVEVTATNVNTGISTVRLTNEAGAYSFASLQPGTYRLTASLLGFQTAIRENVQLSQGQDVRFNFALQVGAVAQSVEVLADSATMLATTSASVGNVLTVDSVRSLPLASRNVLDLARGLPGAINEGVGAQSFGGARQSQINTTRDGLPTGDGRYLDWNGVYSATFTSPDLVEEVQVNVTTADPAMGRGSAQVRMQTRSGSNRFSGGLWHTNSNSALQSNTWFQNLVGAEKNYQNRNQFGGRLGGPIVRNKAFFFVLYDGQRFAEKAEVVSTVLTGPARQGIFRYLTANGPGAQGVSRRNGNAFAAIPSVDLNGNTLSADPRTGAPLFVNSFNLFSDVRDPNRTRIDPVWIAPQYLARMPMPNDWTVGDGLNTAGIRWQRTHRGLDGATGATQTANRNHTTVRFDYQINSSNKVFYSMTRESNWGVTGQTGLPDYPDGYFGEVARKPDFYTTTWTSTLSSTVLNEFRWGLKRDTWFGEPPADVGCCRDARNYKTDTLTPTAQEVQTLFPQVDGHYFHITPGAIATGQTLGQFAWMGVPTPRGSISPLMQFADSLSFTKGSHSFQGGFEFTHAGTDGFNHGGAAWTRPYVTLGIGPVPVPNITAANFPGLSSFDISPAQNILAQLSGSIATLNQRYFINSPDQTDFSDYRQGVLFWRDYRQNDWASFFKDTWRATRNLTLTMGLRYDKYGSPYDRTGLASRPQGGQSGLFGMSGTNHGALYSPGATGGALTVFEYAGKHSPNPSTLVYPDDWNNFAPSLGFSWNVPWFTKTTVLRGGYGITYTAAPTFLQYSAALGSAPGVSLDLLLPPTGGYADVQSVVSDSSRFFPLSTGGARPLQPVPLTNRTTGIQGYADDRVAPYVQSFNLSLQRELARNMTLEIGYIGTKGTKLWSSEQLNTINVLENGILDAFNITRAGGNAPLFDQILMGRNVTGVGVVNGTTLTGSEALRRFPTTNQWIANGEVANLANYFNSTPALTGANGGLLRNAGLPENFIVVNPQFGSVALNGNNDNSIYHALQTQVTQRLSHGFSGQFSYVWSRNIGNSAAGNANASDTTATTRDPRNRTLQRGLVELHRTHNFKGYGAWQLPFGPGRALLAGSPNFVHRLVEGWEISGVFNWTSGPPLDFTTTRRTLDSRANANTPDLLGALPQGQVTVRDGFVEYFPGLTAAGAPLPNFGGHATVTGRFTNQAVRDSSGNIIMQNPDPGRAGNLALNVAQVEGPSRLGLDMALTKRVQINETTSFSLRVDAVNILNTPQWGNPVTDINSATFGRITSVRPGTNRSFTITNRIDF